MKYKIIFFVLVFLSSIYGLQAQITDSLIDSRDGKKYKTVKIGKQWWMAENLNYETQNSFCYNKDNNLCKTYGRLYTYDAAQHACPVGWHLPSHEEWSELTDYLGGEEVAGSKMTGSIKGKVSTNSSGFSGLPGGQRNARSLFTSLGTYGMWWTSSEYAAGLGWCRVLYVNNTTFYSHYDKKTCAFSVRCVKDAKK